MQYRVKAHNTATASTNKIHDDSVARRLGFRGGLVPGVDVYAYLCHLPAERWGKAWLERGTITARFESPVYDGDEVEISGEAGGDEELTLTLSDPSGARCAVARASLPAQPSSTPSPADWPSMAPPAEPPPASAETLAARRSAASSRCSLPIGPRSTSTTSRGPPLFRGWPIGLVAAQGQLRADGQRGHGTWIHVEGNVQLLGGGRWRPGRDPCPRDRGSERGGHRFVDLDVLQLVGDRPVARTAHTAIYQPRGT
ncbi:MAG: hypothetical protein WKF43_15190 [Acidimicrobiales bacterium]